MLGDQSHVLQQHRRGDIELPVHRQRGRQHHPHLHPLAGLAELMFKVCRALQMARRRLEVAQADIGLSQRQPDDGFDLRFVGKAGVDGGAGLIEHIAQSGLGARADVGIRLREQIGVEEVVDRLRDALLTLGVVALILGAEHTEGRSRNARQQQHERHRRAAHQAAIAPREFSQVIDCRGRPSDDRLIVEIAPDFRRQFG